MRRRFLGGGEEQGEGEFGEEVGREAANELLVSNFGKGGRRGDIRAEIETLHELLR